MFIQYVKALQELNLQQVASLAAEDKAPKDAIKKSNQCIVSNRQLLLIFKRAVWGANLCSLGFPSSRIKTQRHQLKGFLKRNLNSQQKAYKKPYLSIRCTSWGGGPRPIPENISWRRNWWKAKTGSWEERTWDPGAANMSVPFKKQLHWWQILGCTHSGQTLLAASCTVTETSPPALLNEQLHPRSSLHVCHLLTGNKH